MIKTKQFGEVTRFDLSRTFLGKGHYWTTCYYVDELLIDSGCVRTANELYSALRDNQLKYIINTHSHEDHFGANGLLQKNFNNLKIFSHPLAIPILADPAEKQPLLFYRRFMWGMPTPSFANQVADNSILSTKHFNFKIIYTPGHSPDHLCLYEPEREWLFTGDLYVGGQDRALRANYNIWQIISSLKKISGLPVKMLFAGSARVRENPKEEIENKISYLEELGGKIITLYNKGISVDQIAKELLGKPMFIELFTQGHFSRRRLVLSFLRLNND